MDPDSAKQQGCSGFHPTSTHRDLRSSAHFSNQLTPLDTMLSLLVICTLQSALLLICTNSMSLTCRRPTCSSGRGRTKKSIRKWGHGDSGFWVSEIRVECLQGSSGPWANEQNSKPRPPKQQQTQKWYTGYPYVNNNNNRRLVTLAEHTSDHGKQTNSSTKAKGEQG